MNIDERFNIPVLTKFIEIEKTATKAEMIFPEVLTESESFQAYSYRQPYLDDDNLAMASEFSDPTYISARVYKDTYSVRAWSKAAYVSVRSLETYDRTRRYGNQLLDPFEVEMMNLIDYMDLLEERQCAKKVMSETSYDNANVITVPKKWVGSGSTPETWLKDIADNILKIYVGKKSILKLIVPKPIYLQLCGISVTTTNMLGSTTPLVVTSKIEEMVKSVGIDELIIVADKTENNEELYGSTSVALIAVNPLSTVMEGGAGFGYKASFRKNHIDRAVDEIRGHAKGVLKFALKNEYIHYVLNKKAGILFKDVSASAKVEEKVEQKVEQNSKQKPE